MWFLGLIVGAIIGAIGDVTGALAGAVVGLVAGLAISRREPVVDEKWKHEIEDAVRQLRQRLSALEPRGLSPTPEPARGMDAPPESQKPSPMPGPTAAGAPTMSPEDAMAFELAGASVLIDNTASVRSTADANRTRAAVKPSAATAQQPPRAPAGPPPVPAGDAISRWLFGGNTLVRVGVIVLFFGVAFLLKYAADRDLVPIELRLAGVALGGIVLLIVGWRLRLGRPGYALMLQGGGVGILYLTVFAALRLYQLIPAGLAFGLLAGIAVFSAVLAVAQDSRSLAVTGAVGGFLAPILASTGAGNHVALFGFYAVLNASILGIAYYRAWREINLLGFAFTFVIGLLWGSQYYRPELYSSTEPFLVLFFLFYVSIAVLFALRQAPQLTHYMDGTLVFGTPLIAFGLQVALVRDMEFGSAWSAFGLAAFYLVLASVLHALRRDTLRLLVESFLALGVGFATLAIPLAFDGRWTSAVWAVEGAAIVWASVRQDRKLARVFGLLLQPAAGFAFLVGADKPVGAVPVLNSLYLGCMMVSMAGLFCSRYMERLQGRIGSVEYTAARLLFAWAALWWFGGGLLEIHRHAPAAWGLHPHLLFFAGSCAAFGWLWRGLGWDIARYPALLILPLMALVAVGLTDQPAAHRHPFAHHGYVGWVLGFGVHLWLLRAHEGRSERWADWLHAAGFWLLAVAMSWEVGWQIDQYVQGRRVWPLIAWALVPGALVAVFSARGARLGWPVGAHRHAYLYAGALPLVAYLLGWVIFVNFASNGDPAPLPYVPLLNPLDLAQAGALIAIATWFVGVRRLDLPEAKLPEPALGIKLLGGVLFVALNGVLLRTLHHYADVPFRLEDMLRSVLVQAAFSLFWSLLALAAMVYATRRGLRALWVVGAVLLAVVIAKLFLVDLANTGTIERVVSFVSVGILVIVIGYFAPVPPRSKEDAA